MEHLIVDRDNNSFYPGKRTTQAIGYLGGFLCCDVGDSVDYIRNALNNPSEQKNVGL